MRLVDLPVWLTVLVLAGTARPCFGQGEGPARGYAPFRRLDLWWIRQGERFVDGFAEELEPAGDRDAVVVLHHDQGCSHRRTSRQVLVREGEAYRRGNEETLTATRVEWLRRRILASRPMEGADIHSILRDPTDYLDGLGFTEGFLAEERPAIWRYCIPKERQAPGAPLLEVPDEIVSELTPVAMRRRLIDRLLLAGTLCTTETWLAVSLPGEPPIHLGSSAFTPDRLPWYVRVGDDRWYCLDRDVARELLRLVPRDPGLEELPEDPLRWRRTLVTSPQLWREVQQRVAEVLGRADFEAIEGWAAVDREFEVVEFDPKNAAGRGKLPGLKLSAREDRPLRAILLPPGGCQGLETWNDVLALHRRAEEAVRAQPWFQRWVAHDHRVLSLHAGGMSYVAQDRAFTPELWREAGLRGTPEFVVSLLYRMRIEHHYADVDHGLCVLSREGDVMIVSSKGARGPFWPEANALKMDGTYGIVGADGVPVLRRR